MGCVYCAVNTINNKVYIGKTRYPLRERRMAHEIAKDRCVFHKALRKYGKHAFEWLVLFQSDDESILYRREEQFIAIHNSMIPVGYNMTTGGDGQYSRVFDEKWHAANYERALKLAKKVYCYELDKIFASLHLAVVETGVAQQSIVSCCNNNGTSIVIPYHFAWPTEEAIAALKEQAKIGFPPKRIVTDEHRMHMSKAQKGLCHSEESKKKRREYYKSHDIWNKGMTMDEIFRQKVKEGKAAKPQDPSYCYRAVRNLTDGREFPSLRHATKFYGLPLKGTSNITSVCRGNLKTAYGYRWEYID